MGGNQANGVSQRPQKSVFLGGGSDLTAFQASTEMRTVECRWPGGLEGRWER